MCGFAGAIILNRYFFQDEEIRPILKRMGDQIAFRGPDDEQYFCDQQVGIVFRRLSIVDLSHGAQPFYNKDRSVVMVVNGEIYNHKELRASLKQQHHFKSNSDCEVLLALYEEKGLDFLDQVNGMFSIMLYDIKNKKVILARDRMGIKPLYYTFNQHRLVFGSEIKSLLPYPDCPRSLDWKAATQYDEMTVTPNPPSFFKDINYLAGGTMLMVDLNTKSIRQHTYWKPSFLSEEAYQADTRTSDEIIDEYMDLLTDAVDLRLMADVELGLFLSGGIDSVAVACLASKKHNFHTFSVLSQSTYTNEDALYAAKISKRLGLPNHQVFYPYHNLKLSPEEWKKILWTCETPLAGAEQLYKYYLHHFAKKHRPDLKVILLGQGSDEVNGGYSINMTKPFVEDTELPVNWDSFMQKMKLEEKFNAIREGKSYINKGDAYIFSHEFLTNKKNYKKDHPFHYYLKRGMTSLQVYNLWHEDRTAMGNSIESRVPFLDHRLVEFSYSLPPSRYQEMFWDKTILRKAMSRHLPDEYTQRKKIPFFYGQDTRYTNKMMYHLLMQNNQQLLEEAFGSGNPSSSVLDVSFVMDSIKNIAEDPSFGGIEYFLKLTNLGLMEKMVKELDVDYNAISLKSEVKEVKDIDWDDQEALKVLLSLNRKELNLECVPSFSSNINFLKDDVNPGLWYIAIDHIIEYSLEESENKDWIQFLNYVDGTISIAQILKRSNLTYGAIAKFLEEALSYEVLYMVE